MITSQQVLPSRLVSLINDRDVDWDGNCEFDENGKVVGFKVPSQSNHLRMRPIPKNEELLKDVREADKLLASVMKPATRDEIGIMIKKLSLHCGMQAKAPEEVKFMFLDYCNDLAEYPKALINEACEKYRKLPEGNNFLPSSGKLISLMSEKYHKLKFMRQRINKILGKEAPKPQKENKELSFLESLEFVINN